MSLASRRDVVLTINEEAVLPETGDGFVDVEDLVVLDGLYPVELSLEQPDVELFCVQRQGLTKG